MYAVALPTGKPPRSADSGSSTPSKLTEWLPEARMPSASQSSCTTTPGVPEALDTIAGATFPGHQVYLYKDWLAGLGVPARIIWGAEDAIVHPVATGFAPEIRVDVIPKAGHLVHLEQAPAVNRLILG